MELFTLLIILSQIMSFVLDAPFLQPTESLQTVGCYSSLMNATWKNAIQNPMFWGLHSPPTNVAPFWFWFRYHMWVKLIVGSSLFSERFFSRFSGFPLSPKIINISKFQLFWSDEDLLENDFCISGASWVNILNCYWLLHSCRAFIITPEPCSIFIISRCCILNQNFSGCIHQTRAA